MAYPLRNEPPPAWAARFFGKKMVGFRLVGEATQRGVRMPGWGHAYLEDGQEVFVPEEEAKKGIDGIVAYAESLGVDVTQYRADLAAWVKTGKFPDGRSVTFSLHR